MPETYTVRQGDTLSAIAARNNTTVAELVRLNNITNPNRIFPGQVLIIREGTTGAPTYTVRQGDTLSAIAARNNTTVAELVRLNNIANPNRIFPGQVLILPGGATTPPEGTVPYTVVRGDTLSAIAARNGTTVAELVRINNIANPNLIFPGQVLFIPQGGTTPPPARVTYTVVRGDTLSAIAARYGTTVAELVRLNNISNANRIYPGQVLVIREGTATPATYTVVPGDTLSAIAARYGTTVANLVRLNNITNANRIYPGQVLRLR